MGAVAASVGATPAQVLLAWSLQKGLVPLPKSVSPQRQAENLAAARLTLSSEHMAALDSLERGMTTGWDPVVQDAV